MALSRLPHPPVGAGAAARSAAWAHRLGGTAHAAPPESRVAGPQQTSQRTTPCARRRHEHRCPESILLRRSMSDVAVASDGLPPTVPRTPVRLMPDPEPVGVVQAALQF